MKSHMRCVASILALSIAAADAAAAPEHAHGKAPEQLGRVSFENSCSPAVEPALQRAVALLHSFWFREGEKTFRGVLEGDPACAIATWGIATTLIGNTFAAGPPPPQAQQAQEAI